MQLARLLAPADLQLSSRMGERLAATASGDLVFDEAYAERALLKDGTAVVLRLVHPGDKALLLEGWQRLSAETRYRRFHTPKAALSASELRYLTEIDQYDHVAIGAGCRCEGRLVGLGIARFVRSETRPDVADAALTVLDDAQRKGLGRLLLTRLMAAARERGVARFEFDVLATNTAMRSLVKVLVPRSIVLPDGPMIRVEMPLHP
jgi:GNAT superfamily N-acetyltransferase